MVTIARKSGREAERVPGRPTTVIIAGVHKAGTTSLFEYLAAHPEIAPARIKELRYFSRLARAGMQPDAEEYDRLFTDRKGARYRLEASPNYLCDGEPVARLVADSLPGARIILLLREPVERLVSLYNRAIAHSDLPADFSFREFVDASLKWRPGDSTHYVYTRGLRDGFYIDYLRPWHAVFGENLKVLFTDDLKANSRAVTADVCRWLGLDPSAIASEPFEVSNRTLHYRFRGLHRHVTGLYMLTEPFWRRHVALKRAIRRVYNRLNGARRSLPAIDPETLERLHRVYAPYNEGLRAFLVEQRMPLPPWLESGERRPESRRESATCVEIARPDVREVET
ncbi:MAG TPA: sulfotransferase [Woeseiaceae bacterium]|nr:sulfotransferase [Woeseiaceae bacterium]